MKVKLLLLGITLLPSLSYALSPEAEVGKQQFAICDSCHNPELNPPLAAPMYGVQHRYKRAYDSKEAFVENLIAWVKEPKIENSKMKQAVGELGLMPALDLPQETLVSIANYVYEESFAPPCTHWKIAVEKAKAKGDADHAAHDQKKFDRFCK